MADRTSVYSEKTDIAIFLNLLPDIKGLQKFGEASVELEKVLELLRPHGSETQQLYENLRRVANLFRRTEDRLTIYMNVADFVDETLESFDDLSEESSQDFLEDTVEGVEGLCRRFDDSLETYNKVQDQLREMKDKAKHEEEDMKALGFGSMGVQMGPYGATVANVLESALPNVLWVSQMAPFVAPAIAGVSAGVVAGNVLPIDNIYKKMAGGAAVGIVTIRLCFYLVTLACPQLNASLFVAATVSALVSFDHINELIATVRCIGQPKGR